MAASVSAAFKAAWKNKSWRDARYRVSWKRRYLNSASPAAYVLESSWVELRRAEVKAVRPIAQELDGDREARFQITSFIIEVANELNQWIESVAAPSKFAADAVAASGYVAEGSEVFVELGLKLADDTWGYCPIFTGVIPAAPVIRSDGVVAEVEVQSRAYYFDQDAEPLNDAVTLEDCDPAVGDGSLQDFPTTSIGIRSIDDVQVDGVSLTPGEDNDYTVSGIGQNGPATIHFNTAPPSLDTVKWSGTKWKANISVEDLADLACDLAGIAASDREIEPVVFPGGLSGFKAVDSQSEWEAAAASPGGTLQNISTVAVPGSIRQLWHKIDDFADGDYTVDPAWYHSLGVTGWSVSGGQLVAASPSGQLTLYGVISFPGVGTISSTFTLASGTLSIFFLQDGVFRLGGYTGPINAFVRYDGNYLYLVQTLGSSSGETVLATIGVGAISRLNISVDADGTARVYADGSLVITEAASWSGAVQTIALLATASATFDNIYFSPESARGEAPSTTAAVYESEEFDLLAAPTDWGTLDYIQTLNGGTVVYKTNVASTSGGAYDGWIAIDSSSRAIQSALKRYLKVRIEITPAASIGAISSPEVEEWVANFTTTSVFISVANLAGLTLWDALERYAAPPGYFLGFRNNGHFFLKQKATTPSSEVNLTQENAIVKVSEYDRGDKRVVNVGRVRYAGLLSEYDGAAAGEASPTSQMRHRRRAKTEDLTGVIYANDVNMGTARARTLYENGYLRKRRFRLVMWLVPWLELADGLTVSYFDDPVLRQSVWGDPLVKWGSSRFADGEAQNVLSRNQLTRLLAWTPDLEEYGACEALVEEVLT